VFGFCYASNSGVCIVGAHVERIDIPDETWIDESKARGKNEVNVPPAESGSFAGNFTLAGDSAHE
jgi:hypothetical protein